MISFGSVFLLLFFFFSMKGFLLNILKTEDNYIDNDIIMAKLKRLKFLITTLLSIYI